MKKLLLMALALAFVVPVSAQEQQWGPEWGEDPDGRTANVEAFNLYNAAVQRDDWGMAAANLQKLLKNAPTAHPAIYSLAITMYNKRAEAASDPAEKLMMADSLMLMYDKFFELYPDVPQAPQMQQNRAAYIRQYYSHDSERVLEAFRKGAEAAGEKMPSLLVGYFNELTAAYKNNGITADEYLTEYDRLSTQLAAANATEQQGQLEGLFVNSGAADCNNIENVYGALIEADPENTTLLNRTIALLNRADCKSDFYMSVAEKLYKVAPTAMIARIIAASYKSKGDTSTASKFIDEAIALATTPEEKAEVLLGVASDELFAQNYRNAYNRAHEIAQINPQNATAHYLMALATGSGAAGCSDAMAKRSVYWLAYDRMLEARRLATADPNTKPEMLREMGDRIAQFAAAFPTAEELFLQGIQEGSAYTVNCGWVSGRTTVRRRP